MPFFGGYLFVLHSKSPLCEMRLTNVILYAPIVADKLAPLSFYELANALGLRSARCYLRARYVPPVALGVQEKIGI